MTVGVRNWPRKPLSQEERTIRKTLDRLSPFTAGGVLFVDDPGVMSVQDAINKLGPFGGTVFLGKGTYAGNVTVSVAANANVSIHGAGMDSTILSGSVLVACGNVHLENMSIRGTGLSYACKFFQSGADVARASARFVWFGAQTSSSGDGPTGDGLYLDGAILCAFDQCAFCFNGGNGLYVNSSSSTFTTNVNTFRDCTFNGNGAWGVKAEVGGDGIAGMQQLKFEGGNTEDNVSGGMTFDTVTGVIISGMDFEKTDASITDYLSFTSSQFVVVENCIFVIAGATHTAARMFETFGCAQVVVRYNRISAANSGAWTVGAVGVFNEASVQCAAYGNILWNPGDGYFINNRAQTRGYTA